MSSQTVRVDYLARVEGEGSLYVRVKEGRVADIKLRIAEPPRLFEGLLRGRRFDEAPDITARICGICPVAHQVTSAVALESALGVRVPPATSALRRLLYLGEWIESHSLHVYMLHAPDFLGYQDLAQMAATHPEPLEQALALKKLGNDIVRVVGGREIHPINVRVGGFYRAPRPDELAPLAERLDAAIPIATRAIEWTAGFPIPSFEQDYEFVGLRSPDGYPITGGRIASSLGLDASPEAFEDLFAEEHVAHSTALHSTLKQRGTYLVGPLARYSLNFDRLGAEAQAAARAAGLAPVCRNPFQSIVVRSVELRWACEEALRLVTSYTQPSEPAVAVSPRAGIGVACTEAPRGILFHRYALADDGSIQSARIVTPTAQNLRRIEEDLHAFVPRNLGLHPDQLTWHCEQAIRNYDPCISCAAHFLRLHLDRD